MNKNYDIIPMNEESISLAEKMGEVLTEIPQEELEDVIKMNRAQRRAWLRAATRKRGRGYTK